MHPAALHNGPIGPNGPNGTSGQGRRHLSMDGDDVDNFHDVEFDTSGMSATTSSASAHNLRYRDQNDPRRRLLQDENWSYSGGSCYRMRMYLTYVAQGEGKEADLLTDESLRQILKADKIVKSHTLYDRWCAKWRSNKSGEERCIPPMSLSSFFFPSYPDGQAFFDGGGDPDPTSQTNIKPNSPQGKLLLGKLQSLGDWVFGGGYTGTGKGKKLTYARSVYTFCRRPGKGRMSEQAKWTAMAMEIGKQIENGAQGANVRVYFGGAVHVEFS
jgi:hypothetical protein